MEYGYAEKDIEVLSQNYTDTGCDILYMNRRTGRHSLLVLSERQLCIALEDVGHICGFSNGLLRMPMPTDVAAAGPGDYAWLPTERFMRYNLDEQMATELVLHHFNIGVR